jgi:hypothetical protein
MTSAPNNILIDGKTFKNFIERPNKKIYKDTIASMLAFNRGVRPIINYSITQGDTLAAISDPTILIIDITLPTGAAIKYWLLVLLQIFIMKNFNYIQVIGTGGRDNTDFLNSLKTNIRGTKSCLDDVNEWLVGIQPEILINLINALPNIIKKIKISLSTNKYGYNFKNKVIILDNAQTKIIYFTDKSINMHTLMTKAVISPELKTCIYNNANTLYPTTPRIPTGSVPLLTETNDIIITTLTAQEAKGQANIISLGGESKVYFISGLNPISNIFDIHFRTSSPTNYIQITEEFAYIERIYCMLDKIHDSNRITTLKKSSIIKKIEDNLISLLTQFKQFNTRATSPNKDLYNIFINYFLKSDGTLQNLHTNMEKTICIFMFKLLKDGYAGSASVSAGPLNIVTPDNAYCQNNIVNVDIIFPPDNLNKVNENIYSMPELIDNGHRYPVISTATNPIFKFTTNKKQIVVNIDPNIITINMFSHLLIENIASVPPVIFYIVLYEIIIQPSIQQFYIIHKIAIAPNAPNNTTIYTSLNTNINKINAIEGTLNSLPVAIRAIIIDCIINSKTQQDEQNILQLVNNETSYSMQSNCSSSSPTLLPIPPAVPYPITNIYTIDQISASLAMLIAITNINKISQKSSAYFYNNQYKSCIGYKITDPTRKQLELVSYKVEASTNIKNNTLLKNMVKFMYIVSLSVSPPAPAPAPALLPVLVSAPVASPIASPIASPVAPPVAPPIASPLAPPIASPLASPLASPSPQTLSALVDTGILAPAQDLALVKISNDDESDDDEINYNKFSIINTDNIQELMSNIIIDGVNVLTNTISNIQSISNNFLTTTIKNLWGLFSRATIGGNKKTNKNKRNNKNKKSNKNKKTNKIKKTYKNKKTNKDKRTYKNRKTTPISKRNKYKTYKIKKTYIGGLFSSASVKSHRTSIKFRKDSQPARNIYRENVEKERGRERNEILYYKRNKEIINYIIDNYNQDPDKIYDDDCEFYENALIYCYPDIEGKFIRLKENGNYSFINIMIKYHLIKIINDILKNALRINIRNLEETYILLQTTYGSAYNDAINESREYEKEEETDMEE